MIEKNIKYIKRDIFADLKAHMSKKEVTMIIGPRQCGKTTIMRLLIDELASIDRKTLFLNLDLEQDRQYLKTQEKLLNKIKLEFGDSEGVVFIDEIQRKKDAGLFIKGLYDANLPYKFVVSGSGNVEIKERVSESLMGRKRVFKMTPITFQEFVNFKTHYKYENRLDLFFETEQEKTDNLLLEYLNFGGYPKVVTSKTQAEKQVEINEIYQSYINQDIINWLKVEKIESFEKLVKLCSNQIGNLIEYSALASGVNLATETVQNYIWYLRKTFVLRKCQPFFRNKKVEIIKSPIFYFYDLGLRNYIINKFGALNEESYDIGFVFENLVFNMLNEQIQHTNLTVNFWRTKSQAEVDFVIDLGDDLVPIEVKFKDFKKTRVERSLRSFIEKYSPKRAFVVTKNLSDEIMISNTKVIFIPFWRIDEIFS